MNASDLSTRIEVLRRERTTDESGATVHQWQAHWKLWANVRHTSGAEYIRSGLTAASIKASVRIRFKAGITPDMRVRAGGRLYRIEAVLPDLQRHEYIDLICESLDDED